MRRRAQRGTTAAILISLSVDLLVQIDKICRAHEISRSRLIENAVRAYVQNLGKSGRHVTVTSADQIEGA